MLKMRRTAVFLPLWLILVTGGCRSALDGPADKVLAEGRLLYQQEEYGQAQDHFEGVRKYHPKKAEAEEALLGIAQCELKTGDGENAFADFKRLIDDYPNTRHAVAIADGLFELGNEYFEGNIASFLFFSAARIQGVNVLEYMQIHYRHHRLADDALLRVALFHIGEREYGSAVETLRQLLADYPRSDLLLRARYELAGALLRQSRGPLYDLRTLHAARGRFRDFIAMVDQRGEAERYKKEVASAQKQIGTITLMLAERQYEIGQFYERVDSPSAAMHHYRICTRDYPGSKFAELSAKRINELGASTPKTPAAKDAGKSSGKKAS